MISLGICARGWTVMEVYDCGIEPSCALRDLINAPDTLKQGDSDVWERQYGPDILNATMPDLFARLPPNILSRLSEPKGFKNWRICANCHVSHVSKPLRACSGCVQLMNDPFYYCVRMIDYDQYRLTLLFHRVKNAKRNIGVYISGSAVGRRRKAALSLKQHRRKISLKSH